MNPLSEEQQKACVRQWKQAAPALRQARDRELRESAPDPRALEALLDLGALLPKSEEDLNGLVEMQRHFIRKAIKLGKLPA